MSLIDLIVQKRNCQDVKKCVVDTLKDYIRSKPAIETELKRIYEKKQLQPKVYVVSRPVLLLIQILSLDYRPRTNGLSKLSKQRIILCKDDVSIERTLMHEIIHLLGIKDDNGLYTGFDIKGKGLDRFNENCTEYLNRHWIFEDPIGSIKNTYPGPYNEINAFAELIGMQDFCKLYFESPGKEFLRLMHKSSVSETEFIKCLDKVKKEYTCYEAYEIRKNLVQMATSYEKINRRG